MGTKSLAPKAKTTAGVGVGTKSLAPKTSAAQSVVKPSASKKKYVR
jgi:hypothetical protein